MMDLSLEQIRSLVAVADTGSILAASKKLNKTHTAILYQLKQLEVQVGFLLLDRQKYKSRLTPKGEVFLLEARRFLQAEDRLCDTAMQIQVGGLGRWHLVYDAIFPVTELLGIAKSIQGDTRLSIKLLEDSLRAVEQAFWREESDFMISLYLPESKDLVSFELGKLRSFFVVSKHHPILKLKNQALDFVNALSQETLILVRGIDPQLISQTDGIEWSKTFIVNDFYTKKEALLRGLGVGWMPEHLVRDELNKKHLVKLNDPLVGKKDFKVYYSTRLALREDPLFERTRKLLENSEWLCE
jgi:DNA-binding transcriptional LysR family regulator